MTSTHKSLLTVAVILAVTQVGMAIYRSSVLESSLWGGLWLGIALLAAGVLRIGADGNRLLNVATVTLGSLAIALSALLALGIVLGFGPISWPRAALAAATSLSFGVIMSTSARRPRVRAVGAAVFILCFLAFEIVVTADARLEAQQRERGPERIWR